MKEILYHIDIDYACFGIIAKNGIVIEAAPISKWALGKSINDVLNYYKNKKNAKINK